jgi:anaerobic magnesium-protoporphyrin IX monomethyl ester cyclase
LFTINKKRVIAICREIRLRKIRISWSCRSRVDTIDEEMLRAMKKAGCYRIYYGIESGDEIILRNIKKFTTIKQIKKAVLLTKKNNLLAFGYFMFGCPGESEESIKKTIKLAKDLPFDYAQFNRVSILPGTGLYGKVVSEIGYDYWKGYIHDPSIEKPLPRPNCNLSDRTLDKYIKKAYLEFYLRPRTVFNLIINSKSLFEVIKYIKAGISMLKN